MSLDLQPMHFFDHPIEVSFKTALVRRKVPPCPDGFTWEGKEWRVDEKLAEWVDFSRHGRMKRNMSPAHAAVASGHGSLGVGRFYFRVSASPVKGSHSSSVGRLFDLYYDRAIKSVDDRLGGWYLYRELSFPPAR